MLKILARLTLSATCLMAGLALLAPSVSFAQNDMKSEHVTETQGGVVIDWSEGVIKVTGSGAPPDRGTLTQKQLMAERNAMSDAYKQLAEVIYNMRVNSETIVQDYVSESDTIKAYVSALIKGAQKMDQRYLDDGTVEVDMTVKLYSQDGLNGVLQPQKHVVPPPPVAEEADPAPGDFTGVIVDCRGLGLEPAMSPAILSQAGGELYIGELAVEPAFVISHGVVGYARSLNQARQNSRRIGAKPLIIKGLSATGNFRTDVVISKADTRQLLGLEKLSQLLKQSKVIFVL